MKLVFLPGNDKLNSGWLDNIANAFSYPGNNIEIYKQRFSHWDTGEGLIDLDTELEKIIENVKDDKEYVIFAKSAGAMLSVYGVYSGKIKPKKCIFVGLPINWAQDKKFSLLEWLKKFDVPAIIMQHSGDPITSFDELKNITELKRSNIEILELPGDDHRYNEFSLLKEMTMDFISRENSEGDTEKIQERSAFKIK